MDEITIPRKVVRDYIGNAQLLARSQVEFLAVDEAERIVERFDRIDLNRELARGVDPIDLAVGRRGPIDIQAAEAPPDRIAAEKQVFRWKESIVEELRVALCTKQKKYEKEIATIKKKADALIVAVAAVVAAKFGAVAGVLAGLVAALLQLILSMGLSAFCASRNKPETIAN
jgi:hypothetical protein